MNAILDTVARRFLDKNEAAQDECRGLLSAYRNLYAFLSQIIPYQDSDLEKLYAFVRNLIATPSSDCCGYGSSLASCDVAIADEVTELVEHWRPNCAATIGGYTNADDKSPDENRDVNNIFRMTAPFAGS
jgi:hypothetical protein